MRLKANLSHQGLPGALRGSEESVTIGGLDRTVDDDIRGPGDVR